MDIDKFVNGMNDDEFLKIPDPIASVRASVTGFSSERVMRVINLAVSCLEENEIYLEIGVMQGRTLIGALVDNPNAVAVAVDNFSAFVAPDTDPAQILRSNMRKFGVADQVTFHEMDSQDFFREPDLSPVGVYFYDGCHNTDVGLDSLNAAISLLSERAVIILDDFSGEGVWKSVIAFLHEHVKNTSLLFSMCTNKFPFPNANWWNGLVVIGWRT